MDGARRPTSSPQQVPAPLLSWLQSSYGSLASQEQQHQQQQQRLDQQQFQEQQQHGARLGQQFQQPHAARLSQPYQQYQQPQRFHEPMPYAPELFTHSLLPDAFDVGGAAGRPQLLSPYHQSHKEQLPPTLRHGARQGEYEGHGADVFPILHNFQRPGPPMSSQERSPKDPIGMHQPSPEHVRSPVSGASSCVDARDMVEAALSPNPVNLSDRNYRPKDSEIAKSRNLPGSGASASPSELAMIRHMESSVHNAALMSNPIGQNSSLGHFSQESTGSVGHMGIPMYDDSSPAIDRLTSSLSGHLGSGSGNTSESVPQHSVANSSSPYYSEASNLSQDGTRYTDSPSGQGSSSPRLQSREKIIASESRSAASVIAHTAPASKVPSHASAVVSQQSQSVSETAYHSSSPANEAQKESVTKKSGEMNMSHNKSSPVTSSAKESSPFPTATQENLLASEDSQDYSASGNVTSSSSNSGMKTLIRSKLLKRVYGREDSTDSAVAEPEPTQNVKSPSSTVEDLSTAKIKQEKEDDTFVFVGISDEQETDTTTEAKNGEHDSASLKTTVAKSCPVTTGDSEEDSQDTTPSSVKGEDQSVKARDEDYYEQDVRSEDEGEVEVGEEMMTSDEFPTSDETHFFEDNYPVDGVECPEQVKCYVCDRLVPFGKFKCHLFFGQVHCITCNRRMVGCQMLDDLKDKDRYPCKKSSSKDHTFKNWSVDPIEFLSYYIRKELVIKRFCAGHTGPPPVNEIVDEITAYLKALGSLEAWCPWNIAFAKCHKYIKERTSAMKGNVFDARLSSSWRPGSESPSSQSPKPIAWPAASQNNSVLTSTAAVKSPTSTQPEPATATSPKLPTVTEPATPTDQAPPHKKAAVEEESKPADSQPDKGPATTPSSSVSEKAQASSATKSETEDKAKPQASEGDSSGESKAPSTTEVTAVASGSAGSKVATSVEKNCEPSVSSRSSTPSSTGESRASSSGGPPLKKYKSAFASKSTGRHGRPFKAYKPSRSTVSDLRTMKTPLVRKDLVASTSSYSQNQSSSSSSSSSQQHGTSSYLYYWAAPSGTLRTVTFPKPANGNYLVVNYPKNPCPDLCPTCYSPLDPCNMTVNCRTFIMSIVCPKCSLSLFVTQGPPEQLVASDRNKNKRAMSSMNFDAKRRRY